jgi:hypothetical protein
VAAAHAAGVAIYGGTITPAGRNNAAEEAIREQVNSWIRTSGTFDGVVDFDVVLRDPANPHQVLPAYCPPTTAATTCTRTTPACRPWPTR